jgi:hypothetical protein
VAEKITPTMHPLSKIDKQKNTFCVALRNWNSNKTLSTLYKKMKENSN